MKTSPIIEKLGLLKKTIFIKNPHNTSLSIKDYYFDMDVFLPDYGVNLQRPFVWELWQMEALIESVFIGRYIPPVVIVCRQIEEYDEYNIHTGTIKNSPTNNYAYVIDGKQRLTTIMRYINNEFPVYGLYYKDCGNISLLDEKDTFVDKINNCLTATQYNINSRMKNPFAKKREYIFEKKFLVTEDFIKLNEPKTNNLKIGDTIYQFNMNKSFQNDLIKMFLLSNFAGVKQEQQHIDKFYKIITNL